MNNSKFTMFGYKTRYHNILMRYFTMDYIQKVEHYIKCMYYLITNKNVLVNLILLKML